MESALILAELGSDKAVAILQQMANERANPSELRAAAAWGLSSADGSLPMLLPLTCDADELTAVHAIVGAARAIDATNVAGVLQQIGSDHRQAAGLVRTVLSSRIAFLPEAIRQLQGAALGRRRQWLLYLIAVAGQARAEPIVRQLAPNLQQELNFFWTHHASNWTNRLDVADQIDFLEQQSAR
jgi:hypothetical protein